MRRLISIVENAQESVSAILPESYSPEQQEIIGMAGDVAEKVTNPFNHCKRAAKMLASYLEDCGYEPKVLRCSGLETYAPNSDKRWTKLGKQMYWIHYVVLCDDIVLDVTRRQFFPEAPAVFVQTLDDFRKEWMEVGVARDWKQW